MTKSNTKIENLRDALGTCRRPFSEGGVFSLFINLLTLTPMFYMINVYDKAVATGSMPTLMSLEVIAAFLCLMVGLLVWFRSIVMIHVASRQDHLIALRLYELSFKSDAELLVTPRKVVIAGAARVMDVLLTLAQNTRPKCDLNEARFLKALSWLELVIGGDPQMLGS